jgi:hypothetical protein
MENCFGDTLKWNEKPIQFSQSVINLRRLSCVAFCWFPGATSMLRRTEPENRTGPRYLVTLEVRAEWDDPAGAHVVAEGTTENVGPEGTLVHLPRRLPDVGSRVRLEVQGESGQKLHVIAEVLRIERNPGHPLAALQLLGETDEWKGLIWEPAAPRFTLRTPTPEAVEGEEGDEEEGNEQGSQLTN